MAEKLPLGPSTSDASVTNWDLAGKARSKCVTDVGHKVQLPLGPSTGRLSEKLGFGGMAHSTLGAPFGAVRRAAN